MKGMELAPMPMELVEAGIGKLLLGGDFDQAVGMEYLRLRDENEALSRTLEKSRRDCADLQARTARQEQTIADLLDEKRRLADLLDLHRRVIADRSATIEELEAEVKRLEAGMAPPMAPLEPMHSEPSEDGRHAIREAKAEFLRRAADAIAWNAVITIVQP